MGTSNKKINRSEFQKAYFKALDEAYRPKDNLSGWWCAVMEDLSVTGLLSQNTSFQDGVALSSVTVWGQDIDDSYFDYENYSEDELVEISDFNDGEEVTSESISEMYIPFSIVKHDDRLMTALYLEIEKLESEGYEFKKAKDIEVGDTLDGHEVMVITIWKESDETEETYSFLLENGGTVDYTAEEII